MVSHGSHEEAPDTALKERTGQSVHSVAPLELAYAPGAQGEQPRSHCVPVGWNVPGSQARHEQALEPAGAHVPALQASHWSSNVAFQRRLDVFAGHGVCSALPPAQ